MKYTRKFSCVFKVATIVCCLIGILASLVRTTSVQSLLAFYTMKSNILVLTFYLLNEIIKQFKPDWEKCELYYFLKGAVLMAILLTFVVYGVSLNPRHFSMDMYISSTNIFRLSNLFVHFITPIMVLLDYLLFDEKGHFKNKYPLLWCIFPVLYVVYVYAYSANGGTFFSSGGSNKYAYFFLDIDKIGLTGVLGYITLIAVLYLLMCYIFVLLDKILRRTTNRKKLKRRLK